MNYTFRDAARYNSGSHMLDSGSHYGYNYEKPAISDNDLLASFDKSNSGDIYGGAIETALLLEEYYSIDVELQSLWANWDEKNGNDLGYFESASEFANQLFINQFDEIQNSSEMPEYLDISGNLMQVARDNTYNGESDLTQCFVYEIWQHKVDCNDWIYDTDNCFTIIWIHTGCDVRGGYSYPLFCRSKMEYVIPVHLVCNYAVIESNSGYNDHQELDERWQAGYTSYPFGEMEQDVERFFNFSNTPKDETIALLKSGEIVKIQANINLY